MLPRISENCLVTAREELKELHVARPRQLHLWEAVTEQPQGVDQTVFVCVVATAIPTQAAAICHGRLDQHEAARKMPALPSSRVIEKPPFVIKARRPVASNAIVFARFVVASAPGIAPDIINPQVYTTGL